MPEIVIEDNIPILQTRGRPPCDERVLLLTMKVGQSFVSPKKRDSLYWLGRDLRIEVTVLPSGDGRWRVWKRSEQQRKEQPKRKRPPLNQTWRTILKMRDDAKVF
jgi:hypothetical protein